MNPRVALQLLMGLEDTQKPVKIHFLGHLIACWTFRSLFSLLVVHTIVTGPTLSCREGYGNRWLYQTS